MLFSASGRPINQRRNPAMAMIVVVFALVLMPLSANAFSVTDVTVFPDDTPRPFENVFLQIDVFSPNLSPFLVMPTEVLVNDNQIFVDLFLDSSLLTVPDSLTEVVGLGMFAPGNYEYTVSVFFAGSLPFILDDQLQGSFTVVPLPPAIWLMVGSLVALFASGRHARFWIAR